MTRRLQHYDVPEWRPWLLVAGAGALIVACGIACQLIQLFVSLRDREALRDDTGDPWDGRSLEWSTPSPPPAFNYAVLPDVSGEDAYWSIKQRARAAQDEVDSPDYEPIAMPVNSPTGFICAFFATVIGFALIWHIWWLAGLGFVGAYATFVVFAWRDHNEEGLDAAEVERADRPRRAALDRLRA